MMPKQMGSWEDTLPLPSFQPPVPCWCLTMAETHQGWQVGQETALQGQHRAQHRSENGAGDTGPFPSS